MNKVIVLTGSIVGVAYLTELFIAYYSGVLWEQEAFRLRVMGPYWWAYWAMMTCNVVSPQLFWFKKLRRNIWFTFFMSIIVNIGMWFERFVIIMSLHRDYLPSSWSYYTPSWPEVGFYLGSFGLFFTCYFLFAKYFPVIAIAEIKFILKTSGENFKNKMDVIEETNTEHFIEEQLHHHH
jgi:molybdopterin-containing oxidoreductase family membrane subunit